VRGATIERPLPGTLPGWQDLLVLLKVRIDALVVCVSLAAAVAAGTTSPQTLSVLAAACLLASTGASAVNHYVDRHVDARMERTRARPLPAGRVRDPRLALWLGAGLLGASLALAWPLLGPLPAFYLLAGAATYALVYTLWLKPRTPWSIVWGGAAGSFAALAGWETGASSAAPAAILLALVLFLWTPSHFWSLAIVLERDYRAAGLPMLPAVRGARRTADAVLANTAALVALSLLLGPFLDWPDLAAAAPAGAGFLALALWLRLRPQPARAFLVFKVSGLYLLVLLVGLVLATLV
jgi:protoheme IX farnesyltransferase